MRLDRCRIAGRAIALICVFLACNVSAGLIDVYILTGQSNSLGTTQFEGNVPAEYGPGNSAFDASVAFFWSNVPPSNSSYPPTILGDSDGAITELQMQQGEGSNPMFWGPEFGFARTMLGQSEDDKILMIKASRGGGGNTLWDKDSFESNANAGHMWGHLRDTVDAGLAAAVSSGNTFSVKGVLYLQGESNGGSEAAQSAGRLENLVEHLQDHIHMSYPGVAEDMRTIIGEIAASQSNANRRLTTAQQMDLADANPTIAFVNTRDLPLKQDGIHFGRQSKLDIGQRFALAMHGRQLRLQSFEQMTMNSDTTNLIFEHFVPDSNGIENGPIRVDKNSFTGFADGINSQPPAGVIVDGQAGQVVFADYTTGKTASVITAGGYDFGSHGLPADWSDSGESVTVTFVNPADPNQKATVSSVAFRLWSAEGDEVRASFLDTRGELVYEAAVIEAADGVAYISLDSFSGEELSNIHQIVFSGASGTLWGLGMYDPPPPRGVGEGVDPIPDFSFRGFQVVPEPATGWLMVLGLVWLHRRTLRRPGACWLGGAFNVE